MGTVERAAVIVASHMHHPALDKCLVGFEGILQGREDLIFVDNGSKECIAEWVSGRFPGISVIRLKGNRLFCGGYNAGIHLAMERGYSHVLIVNSDTEVVNPPFLIRLLEAAGRFTRAAFIGPLVYYRTAPKVQQTCLPYPTLGHHAMNWLPWRVAPRWIERQPAKESTVEFLNGVCVLCRVKALREIGLMDENMGGYMEDADWSWRAKKKGWKSVFVPVPSVVHHEDRNGYEPYSLKTFLLKRNTVYWYLKLERKYSAVSYAQASLYLAKIRLLAEREDTERRKHEHFLRKLKRAVCGLLNREPLGEWFGPPLGSWEEKLEEI